VPHDALQYFEIAFDMPAAGAIALSDASAPGPARIRAVRDQIVEQGITCVLTDPLVSSDWVTLVTEGTEARSAVADPIGQPVTPVSGQYEAMMRALATGLADCLSAG
jgi:zinc transport system substrate-binding protein